VSPIQFRHGDLAALIHEILLETGLKASRLEIEITEGVLIENHARALNVLRRIKALGVRIAMDDFGTGYSSLSYLQSFPFDKLKIDQSFVDRLGQDEHAKEIVRAVIGLGRSLKLPTVAEGVETLDQFNFLSEAHCSGVQGFYIGRPEPIASYTELIEKGIAVKHDEPASEPLKQPAAR
jgi:EAL domain-containing protein (putative c-di-GMP-specific phosphodiesterase class I)